MLTRKSPCALAFLDHVGRGRLLLSQQPGWLHRGSGGLLRPTHRTPAGPAHSAGCAEHTWSTRGRDAQPGDHALGPRLSPLVRRGNRLRGGSQLCDPRSVSPHRHSWGLFQDLHLRMVSWNQLTFTSISMCFRALLLDNKLPQNTVASPVVQMVKKLPAMQKTHVWSLGREDPLEKGMATHSSILAWRIPWKEEPGGRQSIRWQSQTQLSN